LHGEAMDKNELGTFILGLVAAVVIFLLWRQHNGGPGAGAGVGPQSIGGGSGVGPSNSCVGCACGTGSGACLAGPSSGSPTFSASPAVQAAMVSALGPGQITPGTPPLMGPGSFYNVNGPTPDPTFTPANVPNVAGSPTTPATVQPVRSTAPVPSTPNLGFWNRYSYSGTYTRTPVVN